MDNPRLLINSLYELLDTLRTLVSENKPLLRSIDKAYENELTASLHLIPKQYEAHIMKTIDVAKIILANIDYSNIITQLQTKINIAESFELSINIKTLIKEFLIKSGMKKIDQARIENFITKLDPIINCMNYLIERPIVTIKKVADLNSDNVESLF